MRIFILGLLIISLGLVGCKKKKTPLGTVPVPSIPDKVDLLPSFIHVKYKEGSSGVDSCRKCHQAIYEEWRQSFHARSTTSKLFIQMSNDYEFEGCVACHAPTEPSFDEIRPEKRDWKIHEGVTCSSCHVVGNRTLGNLGSNAPHSTLKEPLMQSSKACASCHQPTYQQWSKSKYKEQAMTCQACHMPMVHRHVSDLPKELYKKKDSRKHTFEIPFENIIELELNQSRIVPGQLVLKARNVSAGHHMPTGTFGDTVIFLELKILSGDEVIFFREEKLSARDKNVIPANGSRSFFYNFKPKEKRSYQMVARAYFTSSNYAQDIKLNQIETYFNSDLGQKTKKKMLLD